MIVLPLWIFMFVCVLSVFTDTEAERNALKEHVYPKLRDFCRENYGIEFQVTQPSLLCKYSTATIKFMTKRFLSLFSFLVFCVFFFSCSVGWKQSFSGTIMWSQHWYTHVRQKHVTFIFTLRSLAWNLSLPLLSSGVVFTMQMACCLREWSSGEIFIMKFDKQMQGLEKVPWPLAQTACWDWTEDTLVLGLTWFKDLKKHIFIYDYALLNASLLCDF